MKKSLFTATFIFIAFSLFSQPIITKNDMPVNGDTVRFLTSNSVGTIDYLLTGVNYSWDYSTLVDNSTKKDTFQSVLSTPFTYIATFNNPLDQTHLATTASPQPALTSPLPNLQITEQLNFYKNSTPEFSQVGFGAKINSIPLPIKFDNPDVWYKFPITYGTSDSCISSFNVSIPSFGYYGETRKRVNEIDGWGTLITPFGTFSSIRVKSTNNIHDTIFLDTLGFGLHFDRVEIEYKWLTNGHKEPVLQIVERTGGMGGASIAVSWIDTLHISNNSINELNQIVDFEIYPNPSKDLINIHFKSGDEQKYKISIISFTGQLVKEELISPNRNINSTFSMNNLNLKPGIYEIILSNSKSSLAKKIVIE